FFQAEDGIRDPLVTGVQTCALPISNKDGTFRVGRKDKGTFMTLAGQSPGACDTTGKHGHLVNTAIKGKFRGYLRGTVSGGTFNRSEERRVGKECRGRGRWDN